VELLVFKEKIGTTFIVSFVLWSILTLSFVVLSIVMQNVWLAIVAGVLSFACFHFIPTIKTKTVYEITDDYLYIKSGKHELKIPYSSIMGVSQIKSALMVSTTSSFVRLEIKYKNQNGSTDFTHISPVNKDEFINLLESRLIDRDAS
jgi:Na+/melibiose symporter-like transporter